MKTKALYYACLAFFLVVNHVTIAQNNVWTTSYPYGGYVQSACFVMDPNNPSILYVAPTLGGIYKSIDDGLTWNSMTDGVELPFYPLAIQLLKLDANSNLFVIPSGSQSGEIFKNQGGNWSVISLSINSTVYCIETDKNNSKIIYAGTAKGLYRTDNGGDTWSSINNGLPADVYKYIALDPQHSDVIYVGFSNDGIYKSTNNGLSWTLITSDPVMKNIESIIVNPNNSQVVFSVINIDYETKKSVYKTSDGGNSWSKVLELNLPDHMHSAWHYSALTFNPLNPQILFAASFGKVFKSMDGGSNWTANDVSDIEVNSVIVNPTNAQIMYVGTHGNGVYKSLDGGTTWINRSVGIRAVYSLSPRSLDIDSNNGYIYSGSVAYFYLSVDKGRTWIKKKFPSNGVTTLLTNPIEPGIVYGFQNEIAKSADFGDSWQDITNGFMGGFTGGNFALDPTNPSIIYVAGNNSRSSLSGIYKTTNGGQTWQLLNNGLTNTTAYSIAVHPLNGKIVYTGTRSCSPCNSKSGLFRTSNGGLDWQRISTGLPADFEVYDIFIHPSDPNFVFIATNFGSYKSIDAGENWIKISGEGNTIKSNPDDPKIVYIAGYPNGFQISKDGGTTWLRKNDGIPLQTAFMSLKVDPKNKNHVYISTSRGVYEMTITDEIFFVLSVSPNTLSIGAPNNSTKAIDITSNISWSTTSDQKWLTVGSPIGSNNATITLTAIANPTTNARTATVTVSGTGVPSQIIAVTQTGAAPVLIVSPNTLAIAAPSGSTATIAVSSNINWTTASNQSWLTVSSPTGSNNSTITLTAIANPTTNARAATVTVSGSGVPSQIIAVSQTGAAPVLTVSPITLAMAASVSNTKTIDITSNINWTTISNQSWLSVSSPTGSNNATLTITAQANPITIPRTAKITVSGMGVADVTLNVKQDAANVENSKIFIFPNPTNTMMYINGIDQNSTVSIFDMSGKMLISGPIKANQLNISNLAIGVYLVKIVDKKGIVTSKLLKQ